MHSEEDTTTASLNTSQLSSSSAEDFEYSEEEAKRAEEFKTQGNDFFKCKLCFECYKEIEGHFDKALDMYSEAIFCKVPKKQKAVYYSNRAFTNIKLENYAIALFGKSTLLMAY